jgi:hypothetical protein
VNKPQKKREMLGVQHLSKLQWNMAKSFPA